jgi:tetratricopeptide (TPR) repeat protein
MRRNHACRVIDENKPKSHFILDDRSLAGDFEGDLKNLEESLNTLTIRLKNILGKLNCQSDRGGFDRLVVENRIALIHGRIGLIYAYLGKFEEAISKYALTQQHEFFDDEVIPSFRSWHLMAIISLLRGSNKEGLEYAIESEKFWSSDCQLFGWSFSSKLQFRAEWLLGWSHCALGNIAEAERYIDSVILKCREMRSFQFEIHALLISAILRHLQERDRESLELAETSLEFATRKGYIVLMADIEQFIGEYYRDIGELGKASEHLRRSIWLTKRKISLESGKPDESEKPKQWWYKPRYYEALSIWRSLGYSPEH